MYDDNIYDGFTGLDVKASGLKDLSYGVRDSCACLFIQMFRLNIS